MQFLKMWKLHLKNHEKWAFFRYFRHLPLSKKVRKSVGVMGELPFTTQNPWRAFPGWQKEGIVHDRRSLVPPHPIRKTIEGSVSFRIE